MKINISQSAASFIRDIIDAEDWNGHSSMESFDRDDWESMASFLRDDGNSHSDEDQKFAEECADEIDNALEEEDEA